MPIKVSLKDTGPQVWLAATLGFATPNDDVAKVVVTLTGHRTPRTHRFTYANDFAPTWTSTGAGVQDVQRLLPQPIQAEPHTFPFPKVGDDENVLVVIVNNDLLKLAFVNAGFVDNFDPAGYVYWGEMDASDICLCDTIKIEAFNKTTDSQYPVVLDDVRAPRMMPASYLISPSPPYGAPLTRVYPRNLDVKFSVTRSPPTAVISLTVYGRYQSTAVKESFMKIQEQVVAEYSKALTVGFMWLPPSSNSLGDSTPYVAPDREVVTYRLTLDGNRTIALYDDLDEAGDPERLIMQVTDEGDFGIVNYDEWVVEARDPTTPLEPLLQIIKVDDCKSDDQTLEFVVLILLIILASLILLAAIATVCAACMRRNK